MCGWSALVSIRSSVAREPVLIVTIQHGAPVPADVPNRYRWYPRACEYTGTISLSKVSNMTSEKKAKSKSNDRQRTARDRAAWESPTVEPKVEQQPETPAWHEQAAFHVTLDHMSDAAGTMSWQTHAYHEETGDERVLPGVLDPERDRLDARAGRSSARGVGQPPAEAAAEPVSEPPAEVSHAAIGLSVGALDVIELPAERQAGGEEIGVRLCAQVTFDLTGPTAYLASRRSATRTPSRCWRLTYRGQIGAAGQPAPGFAARAAGLRRDARSGSAAGRQLSGDRKRAAFRRRHGGGGAWAGAQCCALVPACDCQDYTVTR